MMESPSVSRVKFGTCGSWPTGVAGQNKTDAASLVGVIVGLERRVSMGAGVVLPSLFGTTRELEPNSDQGETFIGDASISMLEVDWGITSGTNAV
jgi:hypothetical protein